MFGFRVLGFGAFTVADTAAFSVANSARFNDGDSDHFSFTPRTDPNEGKTFTLSFWVKRGVLSTQQTLFAAGNSASHETELFFNTSDQLQFTHRASGTGGFTTTQVFRDPHAWYNIVLAIDSTTEAPALNQRLYVNGAEVDAFGSKANITANQTSNAFVTNQSHFIGADVGAANTFDGYMAQVIALPGTQQTDMSVFGEFDTVGRWRPVNITNQTTVGTDAEAIVNVASATDALSGGDAFTATLSSVALGTASATREAYVFVSGQENSGTMGLLSGTMNTGSGAVAMTKVADVNNTTEAHYQSTLFRVSVPSGTSGDIVLTNTREMSQFGVIVWTVTGDHFLYDIRKDTDTSSDTTTSVTLSGVPANSVILAGRAGATAASGFTWSSNLTENIDEAIDGTVKHTGASTATASGGEFTITCAIDSGSDQRGRMFAIALSPDQGLFGSFGDKQGVYLPFDAGTGTALGTNSGPASHTFIPVAANYVYNSTYLTIGAGTADNNGSPGVSGRLDNPFSGDFTFSTTATAIAGAIFGCFDAAELSTFATGTDDGALDSMTKSWWYDDGGDGSGGAGSVGAGKIMYGNATQATSAIANGSVVTISRTDSTIKITDDGSAIHTFSQTHAGPVFIMIGHRNITSKSMNFDSITMTGQHALIVV